MPKPLFRRIAPWLLPVGLLQCGPRIPPASPLADSDGALEAVLPAHRIEDVDHPDRPTLRLVRREGDPKGAVAAAIYPPEGSRGAMAIAALLEIRMAARQRQLSIAPHALGVVVASEVKDGDEAARWMEDLENALLEPVGAADPAITRASDMAAALARRTEAPSPFGLCLGTLGSEGNISGASYSADEVEAVRTASATAARVGLSALGPAPLLEAVTGAHDGLWPAGQPVADDWEPGTEVAVTGSAPLPELRLAFHVPDVEAALSGARAIRQKNHPLRARLRAVDRHFRVASVDVALRPAGACAGLTLIHDEQGDTPSISVLASAALLASQELEQTLRQEHAEDETTLALLAPELAIEAAGLAAWTAVRATRGPRERVSVVEYRAPEAARPKQKDFADAYTSIRKEWSERTIPFSTRREDGQGQVWLLAATPCGTVPESPDDAGLRALTVHSLAADFDGRMGVRLEPWVEPGAIGLLAHGPARRGESPDRHAARIARAVANAFSGDGLDGRDVADQRSELLNRVGSDPGRSLMRQLVSGGKPSLLDAHGLERSLATASTADVERARSELAREPLKIALLANHPGQEAAAHEALSDWLAPVRAQITTCPEVKYEPTEPGTWTLETIEDASHAAAHVGVWMPAPRELGMATEYLLERPGGYFDRALREPGLALNASADWLGGERGGGLVVEVIAEPQKLDETIAQTRAILDALSKGAVSDEEAEQARRHQRMLEQQALRSPRGRVVRLWKSGDGTEVTGPALRRLHTALAADRHLVLQVDVRK